MEELTLVRPGPAHAEQVMALRAELLARGERFDGCAGLEDAETYGEWLDFEGRLRRKYGAGYVPSQVYLAVRRADGLVVGIADFRRPLTEFLLQYGGNIGYSVRPSQRRKGYGTALLGLLLAVCRAAGEERVLVTCDRENEVADTPALGKSGVIQRYWITL